MVEKKYIVYKIYLTFLANSCMKIRGVNEIVWNINTAHKLIKRFSFLHQSHDVISDSCPSIWIICFNAWKFALICLN